MKNMRKYLLNSFQEILENLERIFEKILRKLSPYGAVVVVVGYSMPGVPDTGTSSYSPRCIETKVCSRDHKQKRNPHDDVTGF